MIVRHDVSTGGIDPDYLVTRGVASAVSYGGQLQISGLTPLQGSRGQWSVVGVGDLRQQFSFILKMLDLTLKQCHASRSDLLVLNVFATDLAGFSANLDVLAAWAGVHRPACTAVGVTRLAHPDQLLEIAAIARSSA
ncbi:RidA family protein [Streptomyces albipurpureus]|uniref:RidA family protein n=1 Tax=Streptomyces albipurpureus TaxID=2897419 RepID=UPI003CE5B6B3